MKLLKLLRNVLPVLLLIFIFSMSSVFGEESTGTMKIKKIELGKKLKLEVTTKNETSQLTFQWYKDGKEIPNAFGTEYIKESTEYDDQGDYYCKVSNMCGDANSNIVRVEVLFPNRFEALSDAEEIKNGEFYLWQSEPNPAYNITRIRFMVPSSCFAKLILRDMSGAEIAVLKQEEVSAGINTVELNTTKLNLASGTYFYTLTAGSFTATKTLLITK